MRQQFRPIHCKHLSLIESTTARVTSPVLISSLNDIIELNEPNLFCFHNVLWKPNHFLVSLSPDINCFVPSCSLPNRSGTTVTRVKRNTKGNNIFAYSWCVFLLIFLVHYKITCIQEAFWLVNTRVWIRVSKLGNCRLQKIWKINVYDVC